VSTVPANDVRARVQQLADERGVSLAGLSRLVGKNPSYLQQFVTRGSPKRLGEDERLLLAKFFGVDERELGARDPWTPVEHLRKQAKSLDGMVRVKEIALADLPRWIQQERNAGGTS
jgi:lambda repressor-like predicted transcriptional regulator